jgi:hypothetical protein
MTLKNSEKEVHFDQKISGLGVALMLDYLVFEKPHHQIRFDRKFGVVNSTDLIYWKTHRQQSSSSERLKCQSQDLFIEPLLRYTFLIANCPVRINGRFGYHLASPGELGSTNMSELYGLAGGYETHIDWSGLRADFSVSYSFAKKS